ncbi:hypothetical protein BC832DRAFT_156918 [Gaertneriomyces semiglobifer]|nr:hypothetical protein BC832DRAFT_156918 [Gaertneriomyces semiglobifer]
MQSETELLMFATVCPCRRLSLPILQRTLFYHFEELPWAAEALHKLKERNKRLVVLHGPYATGKTSILKWATKALAKGFNVEVSFTDGSSLTPTAPELKPERFWKRLGRQILNNNTISSSSDMLDDLIQIYGASPCFLQGLTRAYGFCSRQQALVLDYGRDDVDAH